MSGRTKFAVARALAVVGVIALAAGAVLSIPRASAAAGRAPLDIALVDVSKSVVARAAGEWGSAMALRLGDWARRAETQGHDVAVVAFGRDVRTAYAPQAAHALVAALAAGSLEPVRELLEKKSRDGARETRLAGALNLARSLARDRPSGSITILGDGTFTGEDPARIAHELAEDGFTIALDSIPPRAWNLALSPLEVARELEAGAPIVVSAVVRVDRGTLAGGRAHVDFELRDALGVRKQRVDFETGAGELVPLHVDLGVARAGLVRIEAAVAFDSRVPDPLPEDDRSSAVLRCGGTLVVGLQGRPSDSDFSWKIEGVDVVPLQPGELASRLAQLDALLSFGAPATAAEQRAIRSFVEHGGGWLDGADAEWIRTRLDRSAPLSELGALVPDQGTHARDVIFAIDASGSMAGPPFDAVRSQLEALVDAALPEDDVSVRFFADDLSPPIRFGTQAERSDPARRAALSEAVRTARSASGPTRILEALETLVAERAGAGRDVLVLLLSDGRDPKAPDRDARLARLKQSRAAARMRVAAVAPVADVDRDFLTRVADAFADLEDPLQWPAVFRAELVENEILRRARMPVIPVAGGPEPAASLAAAAAVLPSIDAAARTAVAKGAQLLWSDERGTPLAAFARRGSGRVVSIAFQPGTPWAPEWRSPDLLAPIVRALARSERSRQPSLHIESDTLVLENVDASFPATAHVRIQSGEGEEIELTLTAGAHGFDPLTTRTAPIPPKLDAESGLAFVHIEGGSSGDLDLALERPRASEFAFEPRRFSPPAPQAAGARAHAGEAAHPLAPPSLALGVCALAAAAFLGAFSARRR